MFAVGASPSLQVVWLSFKASPPCAGLTGSLGASAGVGFAVSHELTHGRTRSDKFMAGLLLCLTYYMHWDNSHQAHHVKARIAH